MPLPLYARCPTCRGNRFVSAIVEMGNGFTPTRTGEFACPDCGMTGEANMGRIMEIAADEHERRELEL